MKSKYTYEDCYQLAKGCESRSELKRTFNRCYNIARENGWLDEYTWFKTTFQMESEAKTKWTYDTCYEVAKECTSRRDFEKKHGSAYHKARINKWLDDYTWFTPTNRLKIKWAYENCYEAAKECTSRRDFEKKHRSAYNVALKNGWLDDYTRLRPNLDIYGTPDNVYRYYFKDFNAVYVGRTVDVERRDREHIFKTEEDAVAKFAHEHDLSIPQMEILDTGISLKEGQRLEGYYIDLYREQGYTILNKAKAGSLGTIGGWKWNRKTCYEEALKYRTRNEFCINSSGAYQKACRNHWLDEYTWLKTKTQTNSDGHKGLGLIWTYEACYEEALKYRTRSNFQKDSGSAYASARKHHWLDDYKWFKTKEQAKSDARTKWYFEKCKEEASKYKTRKRFSVGSSGAYEAARKNHWLDQFFPK